LPHSQILIQSSFSVLHRYPLFQRSLPACQCTYFACSWMLKGSREKRSRRRSYPRCVTYYLSSFPSANLTGYFFPKSQCANACVPVGSHCSVTLTSRIGIPRAPGQRCGSSSTLAAPVLRRCESASRRGCDLELGLPSQIASTLYFCVA
jgi:hypothetical protein